jgi:GrpB-like predicted nucleotidyltransferase (UPF0157 family)
VASDFWRDHQLFRNWLKYDAADREAYESMKRQVAADYNAALTPASDINVGYTDRKSDLINEIMARAKAKVSQGLAIQLVPHNPEWSALFEEVRAAIKPIFRGVALGIEHVGSTSVPGLSAKPTIDVAVGVARMADAEHGSAAVQALGYRKRWNTPDWLYYSKIHDHGEHAVHIHVVEHGPGRWDDYIDFRNELRRDPQAVAAYEALKRGLAAEFVNDRLGYPEAKSGFVLDTLERARARR